MADDTAHAEELRERMPMREPEITRGCPHCGR